MFKDCYKGKTVLITGHTGFKGTWLTSWLLKCGAKVIGVSKDIPTEPSMFNVLGLEDKIEHHLFDLIDNSKVDKIIEDKKPDFVFHLAAQAIVSVSYKDPAETFRTNVIGTTHILDALRKSNHPCTAIMITSDKCYDNVEWNWGYREHDALGGKDVYSGSKGAAELVIKSFYHSFFKNEDSKVRLASTRAGNVVGGGDWAVDRIIPDCVRAWSQNKVVTIRSPKATRPWQHVLEPLSGYLHLGQALHFDESLNGESFNFGPRPEYNHSVSEILIHMGKKWDFDPPESSYKVVDEITFHEAGLLKLNCDKALAILKWVPNLLFDEFVELTSNWYYRFYEGKSDMYALTIEQLEFYQNRAKEQGISWTK